VKKPFLALGVLFALAATTAAQTFTGKVVHVADGDTLTVLATGNVQVRVRLWGVDSPERAQAFGQRSRQFTNDMVYGKAVSVRTVETDRLGRTVGVVELLGSKGPSLNVASVAAGMSWWYRYFAPKAADLQKAEEEARQARKGLWSDPNPTPPWDFRRSR
jgi:endonuclease YncB( thermonuclease family)